MNLFLRFVLAFFFLPLLLIYDTVVSQRLAWKKILYILFILFVLGWIWWGSYAPFYTHFFSESQSLSKLEKPQGKDTWEVPVQGTSMLPTIKTPTKVTLSDPDKYGIERFDIVSLKNKQTDGLYYLKRVIALPGEHYAIKNGYVTINGKILKEGYVLNDLPTYGNSSLLDCEDYIVPDHSFVVMGDNRTVSQDSRIIGFVDRSDIEGVIKTDVKEEYLPAIEENKILSKTIDPKKVLDYLNSKRDSTRSGELRLSLKLSQIASKRSVTVKDQFDVWKKLELPIEQTLEKEGYRFNLAHEYITFGYLDEKALVDQILESIKERDEFLSSRYLDFGVGTTQRVVGACSYPVISVILGWPSNPDYPQSTITYWKNEVTISGENLKILQSMVGDTSYDQTKLRRFITVEAQMNEIAKRLYDRVRSNQWFSQADSRDLDRYDTLFEEAEALEADLFGSE